MSTRTEDATAGSIEDDIASAADPAEGTRFPPGVPMTWGWPVDDDLDALLPHLDRGLVRLLTAAARAIADLMGLDAPPLTRREQARDLVRVLGRNKTLRVRVRKLLEEPAQVPGELTGLAGPDAAAAEDAARAALRQLDDAAKTARAERRAEARRRRPSAEEKSEQRTLNSLAEEREKSARLRAKLEVAETDAARLREELEQARAEVDAEAIRGAGAVQALDGLRSQMTSLEATAGWLLRALDAERDRERLAAGSPSYDVDFDHPATDTEPDEPAESRESRTGVDEVGSVPVPRQGRVPAAAVQALQRLRGTLPGSLVEAGMLADDSVSDWLPQVLAALANPPAPTTTQDRTLRVDVLGGGTSIGGSCVLLEAGDTRILVDCGSRPGGETAADLAPPGLDRALAGQLHAVVLTHAHNDHVGWVPALLAHRPDVPVYATSATADLLGTMWPDSARVLARRAGGEHAAPYGDREVNRALAAIRETDFARPVRVRDLSVELFPAGHIVGAAGVVVTAGNQRVVVSGDVSMGGQRTVGGFASPDAGRGADLLLLESTYADDREHVSRKKAVGDFVAEVTRVVDAGGIALVPAFALGRAQEVALVCRELLPDVPVLIDGLARDVSRVYERHNGPDGRRLDILGGRVSEVPRFGTRREVDRFRGGVVIATSGMMNQGPVVSWARKVLPDAASSVLVVGYQDEESPGRRLLSLTESGGGRFDLPGRSEGERETVDVHAHVAAYKLGAHANAGELVTISDLVAARKVMLVHGEAYGQSKLAGRLASRGRQVTPTGMWTPGG